jgi:glycosyltransferase involved in cell wall biosynthesis
MPHKIAVCIPCAPKDRGYLKYCLLSVQAQTRPPDIIVVALSIIADPSKLVMDLSGVTIPIEYVYSPKTLFAGANRNLAATRAINLGATLLSFFDADDIMHPNRLEYIERVFDEHPEITGLVHHFMVGPKGDMAVYNGTKPIPWEPILGDFMKNPYCVNIYNRLNIIKFQNCFAKKIRRGYGMGANGHITVLAEFWKANPYLEEIGKGEDNHFSASILVAKQFLAYTCDTLSCYMRADFRHFQVGL